MQQLTERGDAPRLAAKLPRGARFSLTRKRALVILLIVGVVVWLAWRAQGSAATVEVAPVTRGPLVVPLSTTGVVEAPIVDASFDQAGRIEQLRAAEGDRVRVGQVLATLAADTQRAGAAQADAAARAAGEQARAADASVDSQRKALVAQEEAARADAAVAAEQFRQLEAGPRPAEVSASVAALGRAEASLRDAEATVQRQEAALVRQRARTAGEIAQADATAAAARARLTQAVAGYRVQEIAQAEAELTQAEADHRLAEQDLARIRGLVESGAVARQQLDTAQAREAAAKARGDATRARAAMLRSGTRAEEIEAARAELRAAEARAADARSGEADVRAQEEEVRGARARREDAVQAVQWSRDQLRLVREGARREEINGARARLRAARARADSARASLEGIRSLVAQADAARATAESARAASRSAAAILRQSELRAPFDGHVARKRVEPGQTVAPGTPVYTVVADTRAWVVAKVDDVDLDRVRTGQEIRVTADAFPGRIFRGHVRVIEAMAEPKEVGRVQAKIVRVRIRMDEGAGVLKPGMDVDIAGDLQVRASVILVPNDAIVESEGHTVVWTASRDRARQRRIRTGAGNFDVTEVLDGLRPGERVIVHGKENLHEGDRVRVSDPTVIRR
jgi:multidrug resistance efflux pump